MSKPKASAGAAPVEEGSYIMVPKTVADIGTQTQKVFAKEKGDDEDEKEVRQLLVVCEIPELSTKDKPVSLTAWLTNSTHEKSKLYAMMKAAGIADPANTDLDEILNKPFVGVVEHTTGGKAKIKSFAKLVKGQKAGKTFMETHSVYLDESFDAAEFEAMPEFIQNRIITSPEFGVIDAKRKKGKTGKGK
jgi:hypothetical protein